MSHRPDTTERVMTLHPAGKNGVHIARRKYDAMRRAILRCVPRRASGIALAELSRRIPQVLDRSAFGPDDGITWYLIAVKQDLQARGLIEVLAGNGPQLLRRGREPMSA